jgi:flagellar hook assembly protein FlgD
VLFAGDELIETLSQQFALHNNYPNPFNPTTKISYSLSSASEVSLSIYNIRGELVNKLTSGLHEPGTHVVLWNGRNGLGEKVSTGVYIYSLSTPTGYLNKRLVLLK